MVKTSFDFTEALKNISQVCKMLKKRGQCIPDIIHCFQIVVENDNRAISCIVDGILQALHGGGVPMKIVSEHRPQDEPKILAEEEILRRCKPSIRGPEQFGAEIFPATVNIINVCTGRSMPSVQMMKSVVAGCMARLPYVFENIGIFAHIVANHKKGGRDTVFLKNIKYFRSCPRNWAIVKRQINDLFRIRHITNKVFRAQPSEKEWRLYSAHGFQG